MGLVVSFWHRRVVICRSRLEALEPSSRAACKPSRAEPSAKALEGLWARPVYVQARAVRLGPCGKVVWTMGEMVGPGTKWLDLGHSGWAGFTSTVD